MRSQFDFHERHIADTIEALAGLAPNSIIEGCDATFTRYVAVLNKGRTDEEVYRFECSDYISGLQLVARELRLDKQFSADLLAVGLRFDDGLEDAA
jgi:hypothetical protein